LDGDYDYRNKTRQGALGDDLSECSCSGWKSKYPTNAWACSAIIWRKEDTWFECDDGKALSGPPRLFNPPCCRLDLLFAGHRAACFLAEHRGTTTLITLINVELLVAEVVASLTEPLLLRVAFPNDAPCHSMEPHKLHGLPLSVGMPMKSCVLPFSGEMGYGEWIVVPTPRLRQTRVFQSCAS